MAKRLNQMEKTEGRIDSDDCGLSDEPFGKKKRLSQKTKRKLLAAALAVFILAVLVTVEAIRCTISFKVTEYSVESETLVSDVRIVMLSDLHESEFGKNNQRLINAVRKQSPDVILCVGDMISYNDTEDELRIGIDLMIALTDIAPVYVSLGNHEVTYMQKHGNGLLQMYADTGAMVLDLEYVDIEVRGNAIRIGGISDYCFNYGQTWDDYHASAKYSFLMDMCDTSATKILMCHRPNAYKLEREADSYEDWDVDVVLAGHTHGGLWQLPIIGSIYLPSQGFFPKYDKGIFDMGNSKMIVGGGLGHSAVLFRLFNQCELLTIDLKPKK